MNIQSSVKSFLIAFSLMCAPGVVGQEVTDTVATEEYELPTISLDELVVEGRTQRIVKNGVEYMPAAKVKKSAGDALSLLMLMQVPQLQVSPMNLSVKTLSGQMVDFFIDWLPATEADLKGLRPEDVTRVEVLDFPDDPRFNGAQHVINYVMKRYEWGGYTKLTAHGKALSENGVNGSAYSKFAYKRMVFDMNLDGAGYWKDNKNLETGREIYKDFDLEGIHYNEVTRKSEVSGQHSRMNTQNFSLRATYTKGNTVIVHTAGFYRNATPKENSTSAVSFSDNLFDATRTSSRAFRQELAPSVKGYYRFGLPKNSFLTTSWSLTHSGTRHSSFYQLGENTPIVNSQKERAYTPNATIEFTKQLGGSRTLRAIVSSLNAFFRTEYAGSYEGIQKLTSSDNSLYLSYSQYWQRGISLFTKLGATYAYGRVNGENTLSEWDPQAGIELQWMINPHNLLSGEGWLGNRTPSSSTSNSALMQSNELLWIEGNPDLKNTKYFQTFWTYSFIPTNSLSLSASLLYVGNYDKYANLYYTSDLCGGLIRKVVNSGSIHAYSAIISGTLRLLNNSLAITLRGSANRNRFTGIDAMTADWLTGTAMATYIIKGCAVSLYYTSPEKTTGIFDRGSVTRLPAQYGASIAYGNGNFNASLAFNNWWSDGECRNTFTSPHFSSVRGVKGTGFDRSFELTLTYTFPYGKKVSRDNELEKASGAGSAILE